LTKAGADFALLENPVLDARGTPPASKLSQQEIEFLLAHILSSVPEETSAYAAILGAGADIPSSFANLVAGSFQIRSYKSSRVIILGSFMPASCKGRLFSTMRRHLAQLTCG
jgi:hypothetical protein